MAASENGTILFYLLEHNTHSWILHIVLCSMYLFINGVSCIVIQLLLFIFLLDRPTIYRCKRSHYWMNVLLTSDVTCMVVFWTSVYSHYFRQQILVIILVAGSIRVYNDPEDNHKGYPNDPNDNAGYHQVSGIVRHLCCTWHVANRRQLACLQL